MAYVEGFCQVCVCSATQHKEVSMSEKHIVSPTPSSYTYPPGHTNRRMVRYSTSARAKATLPYSKTVKYKHTEVSTIYIHTVNYIMNRVSLV